ncbi:hypothetical protein M406DRAFT_349735 [Cryphonectria parasitica EP155]|uniref:Uncharacterized protein n=1 Tax=Cryphonectria parasitica (strain ATCC 38755 / EP155) TaxID=660469 RepID=A0A9P4Y7L5_CRYP1|nr:uncharacterized protein M406DRAFT_349735 [Cryphonectria parasitica EP155]KAF3768444.1 hypothetical protein M406DRAFT_349735 [Cryphonectria parasitica EP155]
MVTCGKEATALSFAPSPPLSASPNGGASDRDLDDTQKGHGPQRSRSDSPPASITSSLADAQPHARSVTSSFTSDLQHEPARPLRALALGSHGGQQEEERIQSRDDLERAFSLIQASQRGLLSDSSESLDRVALQISPSRYLELRQRLEDHGLLEYFDHGALRYDWNPDRGTLVLRLMASHLHERMKLCISDEIKTRLRDLAAREGELARHASHIIACGHAWVQLQGNKGQGKRSPDGQFLYIQSAAPPALRQTTTPQLVTEVGYNQKAEDLKQCAKDYYECSDGKIKTVLTIDLPYADAADRTAAFCLYRGPNRIFKNEAFRDAQGRTTDCTLPLLLSDFIPNNVLRRLSPQVRAQVKQSNLDLPARLLCEFLEDSERLQAQVDAEKKERDARPPKKRKAMHVQWDSDVEKAEDEDKTHSSDPSSSSGSDSMYDDGGHALR